MRIVSASKVIKLKVCLQVPSGLLAAIIFCNSPHVKKVCKKMLRSLKFNIFFLIRPTMKMRFIVLIFTMDSMRLKFNDKGPCTTHNGNEVWRIAKISHQIYIPGIGLRQWVFSKENWPLSTKGECWRRDKNLLSKYIHSRSIWMKCRVSQSWWAKKRKI